MSAREEYFFNQMNTRFNEIYIQNQLMQVESQTLLDENIKLKSEIAKLMRELSKVSHTSQELEPALIGLESKDFDYIPKPLGG